MDQMPVNKDQAGAVISGRDDMRVPDFLVQSAGLSHGISKATGIQAMQPYPPHRLAMGRWQAAR
jgi:hypothetical protein